MLLRLQTRHLLFILLLLATQAYGQPQVKSIIDTFAKETEKAVDTDGGGCVMVAVFKGKKVIWSRGFGLADVEKGIKADANTIGRTGSISKSFTAVLLCQLAEQGVLKLDDPVRKHFPPLLKVANRPEDSKAVTYRMLASHTSGLVREPRNWRVTASGPIESWEKMILEALPSTSFKTKPSTEYSYSNIGFGILGLASSLAAKKPFMSLVETNIFEPLSMNSSTFVVKKPEMKQRLAVGYVKNRRTGKLSSEIPTLEHEGRGYKVPNGGIYSTVEDLAKFSAALMGESDVKILSAKMRQEIFSPQGSAKSYGLGFKILERGKNIHAVGHGGSVAGYRADLRFELKSKWGVATLRTTQYSPPVAKLLVDLVKSELGK